MTAIETGFPSARAIRVSSWGVVAIVQRAGPHRWTSDIEKPNCRRSQNFLGILDRLPTVASLHRKVRSSGCRKGTPIASCAHYRKSDGVSCMIEAIKDSFRVVVR